MKILTILDNSKFCLTETKENKYLDILAFIQNFEEKCETFKFGDYPDAYICVLDFYNFTKDLKNLLKQNEVKE